MVDNKKEGVEVVGNVTVILFSFLFCQYYEYFRPKLFHPKCVRPACLLTINAHLSNQCSVYLVQDIVYDGQLILAKGNPIKAS